MQYSWISTRALPAVLEPVAKGETSGLILSVFTFLIFCSLWMFVLILIFKMIALNYYLPGLLSFLARQTLCLAKCLTLRILPGIS